CYLPTTTQRKTLVFALNSNLKGLLIIRSIVIALQASAVLYSDRVLQLALPYKLLVFVLGLFVVINVGLYWRLQLQRDVTETEFWSYLAVDVIGIGVFVYFTGGASNPFISYLLVPIMICATTLSRLYTWCITGLALAAYTTLLFWFIPMPELMPSSSGHIHDQMNAGFNLHILGMWLNFLVSAALITWFVVKMAAELKHQQQQLGVLRESTLRDEQIMAVATQAASTAHTLGTPLSTMAVILKDMQQETNEPEKQREIHILQQQLVFCRDAIRALVSDSDPQLKTEQLGLHLFFERLLEHWQLLKPEVEIVVKRSKSECNALLLSNEGLQQAIINLLNNAAEAGGSSVAISSEVSADQWILEIANKGPRITPELKERLGLEVVSSKDNGLGVGFLLSHATIERLNGTVSIGNATTGGTLTRIHLPIRHDR
ncbi:MAG: two-component system sensor histidine kinase RegB, partial [Halioglobus sp.]